jgi:hypothetical protein
MSNQFFSIKYAVLIPLLLFMAFPMTGYAEELPQPKMGEAAPPFNLETLQGDKLALADLLGKFVVIHIATSW